MRTLVALLMRLFPPRFRRTFGADLLATFDDRWREDPGLAPGLRITADLARSAVMERITERRRTPGGVLSTLWHDLRFALRMLRQAPGFAAVAVVVLALGVGANTAMFSVIDAVLLRPLPYAESDRLLWITGVMRSNTTDEISLTPDFYDWRTQNHVFTALAAYNPFERTLTGAGDPVQLNTVKSSAALLPLLKVQPLLGRAFLESEDQKGQDQVAIISYGLWQQNFAGRTDVIGQSLRLDDQPFTVVGVLPADFHFPSSEPVDLLTPLGKDIPVEMLRDNGMSFNRNVVARLRPGVTLQQARAEMEFIEAHVARPAMFSRTAQLDVKVMTLRDHLVGDMRAALLTLLGAVGFLLLMACANIANLLLGRAVTRQREIAIRGALGASRGRLTQQLLVESLVLAALGCGGGLALAVWTRSAVVALLPKTIPALVLLPLSGRVLAFTMLTACASALLFGLGPAWGGAGGSLLTNLSAEGRASSGGSRRRVWLNVLASAQMAIAIVLLTGGALMLQSFWKLRYRDLGFRPDHVLTVPLHLSHARYPSGPKQAAFIDDLLVSLATLPGVESAAAGTIPPGDFHATNGMRVEGRPVEPPLRRPVARQPSVSASYFHTLGIPLLRGRSLQESDGPETPLVVVISQTLARKYFPNEDPIGTKVSVSRDRWHTIVGIVGDVKTAGLAVAPEPVLYFAYRQSGAIQTGQMGEDIGIMVRTALDPTLLASALRQRVAQLDSTMPLGAMQTMDRHLNVSAARPRLATILLGCLAVLGLVLACVGLYGVMSFLVRWRFREIGIRLAIGAQPRDVMRMVLGHSLKVMLAGVAVGAGCALWLNRLMSSLLYGVTPGDPLTLAAAATFLTLVGLGAAWIPARQASAVDPATTLRAE